MEGRIKKLKEYIESNKSQELSEIAAFQLGELACEDPELVISEVAPLVFHSTAEVVSSAVLSISQILSKVSYQCVSPSVCLTLQNFQTPPLKKTHRELQGFQQVLETFRESILSGSWEHKLSASHAVRTILRHNQLCQKCREDLMCRSLLILCQDQVADYSGDLPEYPLRDVSAEIIALAKEPTNSKELERVLCEMLQEAQPQGPLLALRLCKFASSEVYEKVKACLGGPEDVVTEACKILSELQINRDQSLEDFLGELIEKADDLSGYLVYALKVLEKLVKIGCKVTCSLKSLYSLFFHNLSSVRSTLYSIFQALIPSQVTEPEQLFRLLMQATLMEYDTQIIKSCLNLIETLSQSFDLEGLLDFYWEDYTTLVSQKCPNHFGFMLVYGEWSGSNPYSFIYTDTSADVGSDNYLESLQYRRILNLSKAVAKLKRKGRRLGIYSEIIWTLGIADHLNYEELLNKLTAQTQPNLLEFRHKGFVCYKLSKICMKGVPLPQKITPIIQSIVTAYKHESVSFLKSLFAKTIAKFTLLLTERNCNDKILQNTTQSDPLPVLKHLQVAHQEKVFERFKLFGSILSEPLANLSFLEKATFHIHPSLFSQYTLVFENLVKHYKEDLHSSLLNILTQVQDTHSIFTRYILSSLKEKKTFCLPLLKDLIASEAYPSYIPYCPCLLIPLLESVGAGGPLVTEFFGEILQATMLDTPSKKIPEDLQPYREQGLKFLGQLKGNYEIPEYIPTVSIGCELRKYQLEGVKWMRFLGRFKLGGMLCDEMGLGKTIQTLCVVAESHKENPGSTSLVVAPSSVVPQWCYEVKKYFSEEVLKAKTADNLENTENTLVVVSYHSLKRKLQDLESRNFLYVILDEGHIIRNPSTKTYKAIKRLKGEFRLILTGTPLQNKVLELWPFFEFLIPGFLGTHSEFSKQYQKYLTPKKSRKTFTFHNECKALKKLNTLHKKVLPFILRRLKKDVLQDLPEKLIQDYFVDLSPLQKSLLRNYYQENPEPQPLNEILFLRKLCNHPKLVLPEVSPPLEEVPKLQALKELLVSCEVPEETGSGHKALVFSQMKSMLDILEDSLLKVCFPSSAYLRMDGSVSAEKRGELALQFNSDPHIRLMLLTTETGGLGLNLQAADVVIFIDHDWNPVKDLQAMDRAHRIGQKNIVNVYRLVTKDTLEETILGLQSFKQKIAESLVNADNASMAGIDTASLLSDLAKIK